MEITYGHNDTGEPGDTETVTPGSVGGRGKRATQWYRACGLPNAVWLLSMKNMAGLFGGGVLGHRLGTVLFGAGFGVLLCTLLGALIGIALTFQYHGLLILRRLTMRVRFYLRRAVHPQQIDAEAIFTVVEQRQVPIRVFHHDGTPVLVPEPEGSR